MIARVSHIEAFRQLQNSESYPVELFMRNVSDSVYSTPQQRVGTAFHRALETAEPGELPVLSIDGYTFVIEASSEISLPPIREMRIAKKFGELTVSGCVDGIDGLTVVDYKTTSDFEPERYLDSFQWRYYLSLTECTKLRYVVFEISIPYSTVDEEKVYLEFEPIRVRKVHVIECFRYPDMEKDCSDLAREYYNFMISLPKGIEP